MSLQRLARRPSSHRQQDGIQVSAYDSPAQAILIVLYKGRVTAVAVAGKDKDTLYGFFSNHEENQEAKDLSSIKPILLE